MAESIVFDVVANLLIKLSTLAVREIRLASGETSELDKLTETLKTIQAVRLDAGESHHHMKRELQVWLGRLKDVCASAEDILDEFEIAALQRQVRNRKRNIRKKLRYYSSSSNPLIFHFKMGNKIKEIREALDEIAADKNKFHISGSYVDNKIVPIRRETHSSVNTLDVIGRDNDIEQLVHVLKQLDDGNNRGVSVISVVGIGGLGKTTLAKSVYNDVRVAQHFKLRKWVCVAENFDVKKIIGEVVDHKDLSMEQLQEPLKQLLFGQRYLLVLDDVWNEDVGKWIELKEVLCCGGYGSKIVVTTRLQSVTTIMSTSYTHTLEGLSPEDSLSLLMKWTLGQGQEDHNSSLIEIGNDIAKKSLGVPLAIRTLGSLLYMKTEERDWRFVRDNKIWNSKRREDDILPVLELSYNHLPSYLRQCFSICSMFEKDTTLNSIEMIYIWMALGFLESVPNENLLEAEDIGQDCFTQLCSKSFFQDVADFWFFYKFKLHGLMHDLALLVTKGESASLSDDAPEVVLHLDKRVRHLGFHSYKLVSEEEFPSSVLQLGGLRTIIADNDVGPACSISFVQTCISKFNYLRVLYFKETSFEVLPYSIGDLKHLRYLCLAENTTIKTLPNSLCRLVSLQTLCLKGCNALEELPKDFGELISLRYLYLTTNEMWLPYLNENDESLNSLRYLEIQGCRNLISLHNLKKNGHLRTLQIRDCYSLLSLPDNLRCLSRLENLVLSNCPKLDLKTTEQDTGSLSSLRILAVEELPMLGYLPMWLVNNQTSLQRLELYDCPNMVSICEGRNPLPPTLKELVIWSCPKLIERCQRDTGEDWHKISHIPIILLDGLKI